MSEEIPLFIHWTDVLKWMLTKTEKFPKRVRFTFSTRIDNLALDVLDRIVQARYTADRVPILDQINLDLERMRVLLRICHELQYLDHNGYERASRDIERAGEMVGGWRRKSIGSKR